jgi:4-diphosphocytidyl-2-C-methyl-D-erythritol kinase
MKLRSHAKLNLSLRVFEKRPDGFHNLESIMQSVSLHDIITLTEIPSGIEVSCSDPKVPQGEENIVYKAAALFLGRGTRDVGRGVRIHIEKRIPMAAGLAGGSSDAAAVLFGLNQMMNAECLMPNAELMKLGSEIGSDVPFCLTGGTCLVKGRGEIVEKQEPWPKTYFILVCPDIQVSAKWAYDEFDKIHVNPPEGIKNDLEPVVVSRYDIVTGIKEKLLKIGCSEAQMSGSGPSVFGIVRQKAEAERILNIIKDDYPRSFMVETVDSGVEVC